MAAATARDKVLFGDAPHAALTPLTLPALKRALAQMATSYLTEADVGRSGAGRGPSPGPGGRAGARGQRR